MRPVSFVGPRRGRGVAGLHGLSTSQLRRRGDSSKEYPRRSRGGAAIRRRNIHVAAAASPRFIGGVSTSQPRRRRDSSKGYPLSKSTVASTSSRALYRRACSKRRRRISTSPRRPSSLPRKPRRSTPGGRAGRAPERRPPVSTSQPRRGRDPVSTEYPRRSRGGAAIHQRNIRAAEVYGDLRPEPRRRDGRGRQTKPREREPKRDERDAHEFILGVARARVPFGVVGFRVVVRVREPAVADVPGARVGLDPVYASRPRRRRAVASTFTPRLLNHVAAAASRPRRRGRGVAAPSPPRLHHVSLTTSRPRRRGRGVAAASPPRLLPRRGGVAATRRRNVRAANVRERRKSEAQSCAEAAGRQRALRCGERSRGGCGGCGQLWA